LPLLEGKDETTYYQRQLLPPVYHLNGAVDVLRNEIVIGQHQLFTRDMRAYVMPPEFSLEIDTELDFIFAEVMINKV
jgi:CMP-N,N'-diacetyllegionaminic acid synthase